MYRIHTQSCCVNHILIDSHGSDRPPMDLSPFHATALIDRDSAQNQTHLRSFSASDQILTKRDLHQLGWKLSSPPTII